MRQIAKAIALGTLIASLMSTGFAQKKDATSSDTSKNDSDIAKRIDAAAKVLDEIMATPDKRIPEDALASAKCIAVVPSMIKGGFIVGGRYGKGVATCRTARGWSAPAPITIAGGSWGLQFGGEAVDLVMLVMNQ